MYAIDLPARSCVPKVEAELLLLPSCLRLHWVLLSFVCALLLLLRSFSHFVDTSAGLFGFSFGQLALLHPQFTGGTGLFTPSTLPSFLCPYLPGRYLCSIQWRTFAAAYFAPLDSRWVVILPCLCRSFDRAPPSRALLQPLRLPLLSFQGPSCSVAGPPLRSLVCFCVRFDVCDGGGVHRFFFLLPAATFLLRRGCILT